jgi:hypothetical protein
LRAPPKGLKEPKRPRYRESDLTPTAIVLDIANRVGALAQVTQILADAGVNVAGLQLGRGPDQHNLRLTVDNPGVAIAALARHGLEAKRTEVLTLSVKNRPGALAAAAARLAEHGVNIHAVFLSAKSTKHVELILQVDDVSAARKALRDSREEE